MSAGVCGRAGKMFQCMQSPSPSLSRIKLCLARKLRPLSEESKILVQQMLRMMIEKEKLSAADVGALIRILDVLPVTEDLLREVDHDKQLNLLQWAVIKNSYQELLSGQRVICLNCWYSNGPLHLACKFGYTGIVQLLLQSGASPILESTACYPFTVRQAVSNTITSGTHAFQPNCRLRPRYTPLQCTLTHDQLEVLKVLMDHPSSWDSVNTEALMSEACEFKAIKCIQYAISVLPHTFNARIKPSGRTVLYRVLVSGSSDCLALVLQYGDRFSPDVQLDASGTGESILHVLYGHSVYVSRRVYQVTRLLDEGGFLMQELIMSRDSLGNTPLHVLARYIGQCRNGPTDRDALNKINEEGYKTAQYLIGKGADLSATNNLGQTPLHMLFECNGRRPLLNAYAGKYHKCMPIINKTLNLFLESSEPEVANVRSDYSMTVFNHVAAIFCGMELDIVLNCGYHFQNTMQVLLTNGVSPDLLNGKDIHLLNELLTSSNRWLTHSVKYSKESAVEILNLLHGLLKVLFDGGMKPPDWVLSLAVKQIAIMMNIQFDSIQLCKLIAELLFLLFTSGFNPNKYFMSTENEKSLMYLARGLVVHKHNDDILHFFYPIEQVLNQSTLNKLIESLCERLHSEFEGSGIADPAPHCERMLLTHMRKEPRFLTTITRIAINDALNWKLLDARKLPLPEALKYYLVDFYQRKD